MFQNITLLMMIASSCTGEAKETIISLVEKCGNYHPSQIEILFFEVESQVPWEHLSLKKVH